MPGSVGQQGAALSLGVSLCSLTLALSFEGVMKERGSGHAQESWFVPEGFVFVCCVCCDLRDGVIPPVTSRTGDTDQNALERSFLA